MMMKELYDITELFKIFKRILKSGPDFDLRRKMRVNGGKMAGTESPITIYYQHFLLFPQCFHKASFSGWFKVGILR